MVETLQVAGKATDKLVTFVKELLKTWENEEFLGLYIPFNRKLICSV